MFEMMIVVGIVGLVFLLDRLIRAKAKKLAYPSFDEYKEKYPDLVKPGRVECHKCGGAKIVMRGQVIENDPRKTHFCSTCGTPLYSSTTVAG